MYLRKIYWTDFGTGNPNPLQNDKIQRANLDGSNVETLLTFENFLRVPRGIALDVAGGKMYWTDATRDRIRRANLDGSSPEALVTSGLVNPQGIALMLTP